MTTVCLLFFEATPMFHGERLVPLSMVTRVLTCETAIVRVQHAGCAVCSHCEWLARNMTVSCPCLDSSLDNNSCVHNAFVPLTQVSTQYKRQIMSYYKNNVAFVDSEKFQGRACGQDFENHCSIATPRIQLALSANLTSRTIGGYNEDQPSI